MSNLFLTLVIAFVIIVFAIALLAIGWLITGKTKIEKACGRDPTQKRGDSCNTCEVCAHPDPILKDTHTNHQHNSPTSSSCTTKDEQHVS